MNKKIQTYDDLVEERKRLENLLVLHKHEIKEGWEGIKHSLNPFNSTVAFLGKVTRRDKTNPLVNFGVMVAGDLLLKKFLLGKAGFLTRLIVPFVVKNYSSHVLSRNGGTIMNRLKNLFKRKPNQNNGEMDLTSSDWSTRKTTDLN